MQVLELEQEEKRKRYLEDIVDVSKRYSLHEEKLIKLLQGESVCFRKTPPDRK